MTAPMFFADVRGTQWPVSRIKRIGWPTATGKEWPPKVVTVDLDGEGPSVAVLPTVIDEVVNAPQHVIAALPATYVLNAPEPGDVLGDILRWKTSVIAWAIPRDGYPVPISLDGHEDRAGQVVLLPDGTVHSPLDQSWESAGQWFADALAGVEKHAAQAKEASA